MRDQAKSTESIGNNSAFQLTGLPVRRVLIVDDNKDAVAMETRLLTMLGQTVEYASDGPTAIRIAAQFRPQIVLLDLDLPGMSGFDIARHWSASDWIDDARLIAYTGFTEPRFRSAAMAAGFDDFVLKPIPIEQLLAILRGAASPT